MLSFSIALFLYLFLMKGAIDMASIEKKLTKRGTVYKIRVLLGKDSNGKQIRQSTTYVPDASLSASKIEKAVQKFAIEYEEKIMNGMILSGEKMSFENYCNTWLDEVVNNLSPSTYDYYKYFIDTKLTPALGYFNISDIKPKHIKDFIYNLKGAKGQELKPSSVKKDLAIIKSIFKTAWEDEIIGTNPAIRVKPPKQEMTDKIKCFNAEQAQTFLDILNSDLVYDYNSHIRVNTNGTEYSISSYRQNHAIPTQFRIFFNIAIIGGLRKGEVLGLTWNDIDFDDCVIHINKSVSYSNNKVTVKEPKSKTSIRDVRLPVSLIKMIKDYRTEWLHYKMELGTAWENEDDFMFIQSTGKLMHPSTPYHTFKKILNYYNDTVADESNKLPLIPLHGLRHTSATLLLSENIDISTVSKRLGHAQKSTTMNIYAHSLEKQDKVASDKMEDMFYRRNPHESEVLRRKCH